MARALPWFIAGALALAFVASFSELQRMRTRFGEVTQRTFHDHQDVRVMIIRLALTQATRPIVVMGDSLAEMAPLPLELAGSEVVNAGIGGITSRDLVKVSARLLDKVTPALIVVSVGANDSASSDYSELFESLKRRARVLVIPSASDAKVISNLQRACRAHAVDCADTAFKDQHRLPDGIHLNKDGYQLWTALIARYVMEVM